MWLKWLLSGGLLIAAFLHYGNRLTQLHRTPQAEESGDLAKPDPGDHIAPSPMGTGGVILHRTFSVSSAASYGFVIPAHAAIPQLHGTFRSFVHPSGRSQDQSADIGFLLLNQEQYDSFSHGHPSDALASIDASHNQDVNFGLPASLNQPLKYYLVFRNLPHGGPKVVQADFSVSF
jgi:hypothetical protein